MATSIHEWARLFVGGVDLGLLEHFFGGPARHPPARSVVDAVAAQVRMLRCPKNETGIPVATRDQDRMTGLRVVVVTRKGAGRPLAVDVDVPEFGMVLALHEVVADLIDQ